MMTHLPPKCAAPDAGFTILELLVSLTLLALIVAAVPGIVRMAGKSVQVAGGLTRAHADIPALTAIGDKLSQARPLMAIADDGSRRIQFWGTEESVRFIAPGVLGESGGLITYELGLAQSRAGPPILALTRTLMIDSETDGGPSHDDIRTPMPMTRRLSFRYFGSQASDEAAGWSDRWDSVDAIPQLVEIRTFSARAYAPQVRTITVQLQLYQTPVAKRRR
jgi:general secretion pathway protein J